MPVITLELPEEMVARWEKIPENERDVFALADLVEEFEEPIPSSSLSVEDIASIQSGLEDCDAGRVIDGETFFANLDRRLESLQNRK